MGLSGRQLNEDVIMFGEPLSEKALKTLEKNSPDANSIIKSLPKSAFIPITPQSVIERELTDKEKKQIALKEEAIRLEEEVKYKRERKRKKKTKPTIVEQIIEQPIISNNEEEKMDLEAELKALEKEVEQKETPKVSFSDQPKKEIPESAPEMKDQILTLLNQMENAPPVEQIEVWKERYGKSGIHVMAFGEEDVYIYHHLTRGEWKKIKDLMNKMKETSSDVEEIEEKLKEKVTLYCVLWPSVDEDWLNYCKAGVLDSLYQMILLNSGFLTPQQAMLLTTQL